MHGTLCILEFRQKKKNAHFLNTCTFIYTNTCVLQMLNNYFASCFPDFIINAHDKPVLFFWLLSFYQWLYTLLISHWGLCLMLNLEFTAEHEECIKRWLIVSSSLHLLPGHSFVVTKQLHLTTQRYAFFTSDHRQIKRPNLLMSAYPLRKKKDHEKSIAKSV